MERENSINFIQTLPFQISEFVFQTKLRMERIKEEKIQSFVWRI